MVTKPFAATAGQTVQFDDWNSLIDDIYAQLGSVAGDRIPEGAGLTTDQMRDRYHLSTISRELLPIVNGSGAAVAVFDLGAFTANVQTYRVPANGSELDLGAPIPFNAPSGRKGYLAAISIYVQDLDLDGSTNGVGLKAYKGGNGGGWTLLGSEAIELKASLTWYYIGFTDIFTSPAMDMVNGDMIKFAIETFTGTPNPLPALRGLTVFCHFIQEHFS